MLHKKEQVNKQLKIKVCGMKYPENIAELSKLPIDYMGLIFYNKSPRYVDTFTTVRSSIPKVGVFVNEKIEVIRQKVNEYTLQAVQLHGNETPELCQQLRADGLFVLKAFGIDPTFDWSTLEQYLDAVDALLFDTKSVNHGGTGQIFDWEQLKDYPYDKPYFLSGGLSLENIEQVSLYADERLIGLDLNSKFEIEPGLKNINLLTQALKMIKQ